MSKFKTVTGESSAHRIFDGELRVCSSDKDKNYRVKLMLLNGKRNRNGWVYENIQDNLDEFNDIPILYSVIDGKIANGHDFELVEDTKTGKKYASFIGAESEHPAGWIPSTVNGKSNAHIETIDGTEWVVAEGILPAFYNKEFIDEMTRNNGKMRVSIETLVHKNRMEGDTEYEEQYTVTGVTVISVREAVAGANIRKLSASLDGLEEIKLRAASLNERELNKEPQTQRTKIQKGEQRSMKVLNLEDLRSKFNGYSILAVNGMTVAMLSEKGRPCVYTFGEGEDTVIPEKIQEIAVNSVFGEGENAVNVSATELIGTVKAQLNAVQTALEEATKTNTQLSEEIRVMKDKETERRKKIVVDEIKKRLQENKDGCGANIADDICDDMLASERVNEYAAMEKNGDFCGDEAARCEVDARCMKAIREYNKARVNSTQSIWDIFQSTDREDRNNASNDVTVESAVKNIAKK